MSPMPKTPPVAVTVNGEEHIFTRPPTVRQLLAKLELPDRGIAVAVDGAVCPKARWDEPVERGAEIEILTAVQGG